MGILIVNVCFNIRKKLERREGEGGEKERDRRSRRRKEGSRKREEVREKG